MYSSSPFWTIIIYTKMTGRNTESNVHSSKRVFNEKTAKPKVNATVDVA